MKSPHLKAAVAAVLLVGVALGGINWYARYLEQRYIHALAPQLFNQKLQGIALQAAAFRQSDLLPLYGSSELEIHSPYHPNVVFRAYPTGFTVFPVGRPGATCLIMLQKLAAVGGDLRGKKVALSVSPDWFFDEMVNESAYAGNFSRLQAFQLIFDNQLSWGLKQRIARRMLQYPATLENAPLLKFALRQLVEGSSRSRTQYALSLPLGKLKAMQFRSQDHWATLMLIREQSRLSPQVPRQADTFDWPLLITQAERERLPLARNNDFGFDNRLWLEKFREEATALHNKRSDDEFLQKMQGSLEWTDLDLLLQLLKERGAQPLILSAPMHGVYYNYLGVTRTARQVYYDKLQQAAATYKVPLLSFADHDEDKYFCIDPTSHLSRKGWVYYEQALDAFYHGTLQ